MEGICAAKCYEAIVHPSAVQHACIPQAALAIAGKGKGSSSSSKFEWHVPQHLRCFAKKVSIGLATREDEEQIVGRYWSGWRK